MQYSRETLLPKKFLSQSITLTSDTAVGSSTLMDYFEKKFQTNSSESKGVFYPQIYISASKIMRRFARELDMTIEEFAQYTAVRPGLGYDVLCDKEVQKQGRNNHVLAEGRLVHVFIPHAFHVLLTCDIEIRAERRAKDLKIPHDLAKKLILERDEIDKFRYKKLYSGCLWNSDDFDLVIGTDWRLTIEQEAEYILAAHKRWVETPLLQRSFVDTL